MILYDQETERDCMRACIRTVMQRFDVPDFWNPSAKEQDRRIREWLKRLTHEVAIFYFSECSFEEMSIDFDHLAIVWGPSPRHKDFTHAVVVHSRNDRMYVHHDPHKSRKGIESVSGLMLIYPKLYVSHK